MNEPLRDLARTKSYVGPYVATLVLYWFFVVPGLVANYMFLKEGERMEELAGEPLPGVRELRGLWRVTIVCLSIAMALLAAFFVLLVVLVITSPHP